MNLVIVLILTMLDDFIYTRYLFVEIPVEPIIAGNSIETKWNQFHYRTNTGNSSQKIQSWKWLKPDRIPITAKGSTSPGFCGKCGKSGEYKEYFQIQCTTFDQYFKCQSKCVTSEAKSTFECIKNSGCEKKCESRCKNLWPAAVSYDAYCNMMDYIQRSALWNPYENGKELVEWIATYYVLQKQGGKKRKDCKRYLSQSRTFSKAGTRAFNYAKVNEDQFDKNAPVWDISLEELNEAYKITAMKRHLPWDTEKTQEGKNCLPFYKIFNKRKNFPRRITWLYVDDGCHHRAHLFSQYLMIHLKEEFPTKKFDPPKKHFIFGDLHYETKNAINGKDVSWGFHVAPALKISGKNELYILDPSIRPIPLTKSEYHEIFQGAITGYVTCDSDTYNHLDDCFNPTRASFEELLSVDRDLYLDKEWDLQVELGRKPKIVLGDKYREDNHYEFDD